MNFQGKGESDSMTLDCEELDYGEDGIGCTYKKSCPVALGQDLEEGEISDLDDEDYLRRYTCSFFQRGQCGYGEKCVLLHMTDKGLYRMLDSPSNLSSHSNSLPSAVPSSRPRHSEVRKTDPTAWDRALWVAKKRDQQCDNTKAHTTCQPVVITIESDEGESQEKTACPDPKVSSISKNLSGSSKHKPILNENEWRDPWKRSPIRHSRKKSHSSTSSGSECCSLLPSRRKRSRLSFSERRRRKVVEDRYSRCKTISRRCSSSSSSPAPRSSKKMPVQQRKPQSPKKQNVSPFTGDKPNKNSKELDSSSKGIAFGPPSGHQPDDVHRWTPKKLKTLAPPVQSCSDMSISPLTDSSLSDLFDPDKKKTHSIVEGPNRARSFADRKMRQVEVYGPVCPRGIQPAVSNAQESSPALTIGATKGNNTSELSKPKEPKKRKVISLECELFKFHKSHFPVSEFTSSKVVEQKAPEPREKTPKSVQNQSVQSKTLSRKEALLKQLEEIDAAIERKKTQTGNVTKKN